MANIVRLDVVHPSDNSDAYKRKLQQINDLFDAESSELDREVFAVAIEYLRTHGHAIRQFRDLQSVQVDAILPCIRRLIFEFGSEPWTFFASGLGVDCWKIQQSTGEMLDELTCANILLDYVSAGYETDNLVTDVKRLKTDQVKETAKLLKQDNDSSTINCTGSENCSSRRHSFTMKKYSKLCLELENQIKDNLRENENDMHDLMFLQMAQIQRSMTMLLQKANVSASTTSCSGLTQISAMQENVEQAEMNSARAMLLPNGNCEHIQDVSLRHIASMSYAGQRLQPSALTNNSNSVGTIGRTDSVHNTNAIAHRQQRRTGDRPEGQSDDTICLRTQYRSPHEDIPEMEILNPRSRYALRSEDQEQIHLQNISTEATIPSLFEEETIPMQLYGYNHAIVG
ncbi:hypothetical protein MAR_036556 [Mya arenaria]|uniref:Uncharacterized protein n=1 Tax=Mya arenaria TaxID=6604 RepID=A0ABY7FPE0_MYAAR|nr:hypothetical protein MAR_036556 [Mya arenaria]